MRPIHIAVHVLMVLVLPPVLIGLIARTKAIVAGRVGPPILQLVFDLIKLVRKDMVLSTSTSWVFLAGPVTGLVTTVVAALLLPLGGHDAPIRFDGDFVLFAYALGLGRFFTVAAALDTGSAFAGMGGAREATFSALAEPAIFFGLLVLARASGQASLSGMLGASIAATWSTTGAALAAVVLGWFVVLLAENSRIPFDDPTTHLELTMVHEAMILDQSGPGLGLILYGAAMKLFVFGALVAGVAVPLVVLDPWLSWAILVLALVVLAVLIGLVESTIARLRLSQVPNLLVAACLLTAFGAILLVR
jgi:formate hydrogenlyase subunit 4